MKSLRLISDANSYLVIYVLSSHNNSFDVMLQLKNSQNHLEDL